MKKNDFIKEVIDQLDLEDQEITSDTNLENIDDYDSFAVLSLVALIHKKFNIQLRAKELQEIKTIAELISLIGDDNFE